MNTIFMGVEKSVVNVEMLRSVQCSNVKSELCLEVIQDDG
jgi:hypothetical protein